MFPPRRDLGLRIFSRMVVAGDVISNSIAEHHNSAEFRVIGSLITPHELQIDIRHVKVGGHLRNKVKAPNMEQTSVLKTNKKLNYRQLKTCYFRLSLNFEKRPLYWEKE